MIHFPYFLQSVFTALNKSIFFGKNNSKTISNNWNLEEKNGKAEKDRAC